MLQFESDEVQLKKFRKRLRAMQGGRSGDQRTQVRCGKWIAREALRPWGVLSSSPCGIRNPPPKRVSEIAAWRHMSYQDTAAARTARKYTRSLRNLERGESRVYPMS
jgi:hypothetical protein